MLQMTLISQHILTKKNKILEQPYLPILRASTKIH